MRFLLISLLVFGMGCSVQGGSSGRAGSADKSAHVQTANPALRSVRKVLVLPVEVGDAASDCVLGVDLYKVAASAFSSESVIEVLADEKVVASWSKHPAKAAGTESDYARAAGFAKQHGADAVLIPVLQQCSERRGGKYGADSPAAVLLTFSLVAVDGEVEVWRGGYRSKDEPLSENLLRLKDKKLSDLHFHTASELIVAGFREGARELEARRVSAFTSPSKS